MKTGLTYDDVLINPAFSSLSSRDDVSLKTTLGKVELDIPVVSAPMDTITGSGMAIWLGKHGGLGIIHRYQSVADQAKEVEYSKIFVPNVGAAIATNSETLLRAAALVHAGADLLCFDVAHGYTKSALNHISRIASDNPTVTVVSGNVATPSAARDVLNAGAQVVRVGIGAGSACTTRMVAGIGVPQLSAIIDIAAEIQDISDAYVIADGGIRSSADIVKALAGGADAVMLGGLFASYPVTPNPGRFRGMASLDALEDWKGLDRHIVEGVSFEGIKVDSEFEHTFASIIDGVKLGLAYTGSENIAQLQWRAEFVQITGSTLNENYPHFRG